MLGRKPCTAALCATAMTFVLGCVEEPGKGSLESIGTATGADFPKVGGNLGNQSYSALDRINKDNIDQLGGAWLVRVENGWAEADSQGTPIVVDGVVYVETARGNVVAVDGATGEILWRYESEHGTTLRRGLGHGGGMLFTAARGNWIIALNKDTGEVVWERQYDGYGNLIKPALTYFDGKVFVGSHDSPRSAALTLDARNGDLLWHFWGVPGPGEFGHDTWEGDSWESGGASPWMAPAIDPELNMVYWTFGNARSGGANDGSTRGGTNLFANSIVALDVDTGEYRWHFQSVHHDIWDMDNVMTPVLLDAEIDGEMRPLLVYGSKTGMHYILDRRDGSAPLGIEERPVPQDERQKTWPTQPYPIQGGFVDLCVVEQPLGTEIPGHRSRAVPNYKAGCLFDPHWDEFVLSIPGIGGGSDTNLKSYSHSTGLLYTGVGYVATAHHRSEGGVGHRPAGQYMTGGVVAVDPTTNETVWEIHLPYEMSHGNGVLSTAGDVLFIGQPDGYLLGLDALTGEELWRFQTGAAVTSSPATYEIDGEQYVVTLSGGTRLPYGNTAPRGDYLWAFKLGGNVPEAAPPPPPDQRRPVSGEPVPGEQVDNTVILGRAYNPLTRQLGGESTQQNAMAPTHMVVPVGTTVTFVNPADNVHEHCATQFFEGLFNPRLAPGESFQYRFDEPGEYFFNDCHGPRATGKIEVVLPTE